MRAAPPTADEPTAIFNDLLARPAGDVPDDSGLDDETAAAIERVWAAGPDASPSLGPGLRAAAKSATVRR